jgi:hypothetical protein
MKQPTVILATGFARTGKDTFADAFLNLIEGSRKVAFADILKAASNLFLERLGLHGMADLNRESDKTRFRDFLVAGGKMARALDPDVFAREAAHTAKMNLLCGRCVVISDWRYANELVAVQTICAPYKVVTVRLHREDTGPANDEEAVHMAQIEDTCRIDHEVAYKSGETGLIRDLALTIAASIPNQPGA